MRRIIITAMILICSAGASMAQKDAISQFFSDYEYDRSFTVVTISGRMFSMFTNLEVEDQDDQEIIDMVSKLTGLKILTKDGGVDGFKMYREATQIIQKENYEELMSIREDTEDIKFYAIEKDGSINELLMILGGEDQFMLMSLTGIIELKQLSKLSRKMDIDGLEHLEKLEDN